MSTTPTRQLAEYAVSTRIESLPEAVKERARHVIFDEMACAYFCQRSTAGPLAARYAMSFGGAPEASILGTNYKCSAPYAALANGTAGHGEEVDGAHVLGGHPGASIVHAAVAMAERQHVTGAELLNAVVLGYDIGVRVMKAMGGIFVVKQKYHLHADFVYAFGATAAATRLMGLDATRHCHALALASFQTNGLIAMYAEQRHISKSFCNGQYAFAGVSSALMSAAGLEGNEDMFGAPHGILDAWGTGDSRAALTGQLGHDFSIMSANFKFLNAGYPIHAAVEAASKAIAASGCKLEEIESVRVGMPENALRVVDNRPMHNICVQDMVTAALLRGGLTIDDIPFPDALAHPLFAQLRPRISAHVDEALNREQPDGRGSHVTVTTKAGHSYSHRVDHPRGHSLRGGVSWDDLYEKWQKSLLGCDVSKAISVAKRLDDLSDARELVKAFSGVMR